MLGDESVEGYNIVHGYPDEINYVSKESKWFIHCFDNLSDGLEPTFTKENAEKVAKYLNKQCPDGWE